MHFIQTSVKCEEAFREILIAEMSMINFDSFVENDNGFDAFIEEDHFDETELVSIFERYPQAQIQQHSKRIKKENWNEEWEKNYDPIKVKDQIYVRANFHEPDASFPYQIIINPKMSFGTGHHETTAQMLGLQLNVDHQNKTVIDIGSGTGILAIMASKLGAKDVAATDIDDWCIENSLENFELNNVQPDFVKKGEIESLNIKKKYGVVLANINTNILLAELAHYVEIMTEDAKLLLSGFYDFDKPKIIAKANELGLFEVESSELNKWCAVVFEKSTE